MNKVQKKVISISTLVLLDMLVFLLAYLSIAFSTFGRANLNGEIFSLECMSKFVFFPFSILFVSYILKELYSYKTYLIWEEIRRIVYSSLLSLVIIVLGYLYLEDVSGGVTVASIIILFVPFNILFRYFNRLTLKKLSIVSRRAAIIGGGFQGEEFVNVVSFHPFSGYEILGYVNYGEMKIDETKLKTGTKVLGHFENIEKLLEQHKIDEIIVAVPRIARNELDKIIYKLEGKVRHIKFIPDMFGLITFSTKIDDYERVLTISTSQGLLNPINKMHKRIFDIVGGVVGLILLIPITVISFILIKIDDGGKVFFKQIRVGLNGEKIKIWKFRTMKKNAEKILNDLMEKNREIKEEYLTNKKLKNDPRITRGGHLLRKTSLDEFPQFINVLKGEMSIVGPRPYLFGEITDMGKQYNSIIKTKPGITGLWQASGRNELSFEERTILDQYYVRNWSLWFDIVIVLKTIWAVVKKKGAM